MDYLNATPEQLAQMEREAYAAGDTDRAALLAALMDTPDPAEMEKAYEAPMEQSEFRRALIEDIQLTCKGSKNARFRETKELAQLILRLIDDSYVEL